MYMPVDSAYSYCAAYGLMYSQDQKHHAVWDYKHYYVVHHKSNLKQNEAQSACAESINTERR